MSFRMATDMDSRFWNCFATGLPGPRWVRSQRISETTLYAAIRSLDDPRLTASAPQTVAPDGVDPTLIGCVEDGRFLKVPLVGFANLCCISTSHARLSGPGRQSTRRRSGAGAASPRPGRREGHVPLSGGVLDTVRVSGSDHAVMSSGLATSSSDRLATRAMASKLSGRMGSS